MDLIAATRAEGGLVLVGGWVGGWGGVGWLEKSDMKLISTQVAVEV